MHRKLKNKPQSSWFWGGSLWKITSFSATYLWCNSLVNVEFFTTTWWIFYCGIYTALYIDHFLATIRKKTQETKENRIAPQKWASNIQVTGLQDLKKSHKKHQQIFPSELMCYQKGPTIREVLVIRSPLLAMSKSWKHVFHQQSKYRTQCLLAFHHFWAAKLENWFTSV